MVERAAFSVNKALIDIFSNFNNGNRKRKDLEKRVLRRVGVIEEKLGKDKNCEE